MRSDQVEMKAPMGQSKEAAHERAAAILAHNKMQLQWAITKHPVRKAALAERLKQSWIKLGGPMPSEVVVPVEPPHLVE